MRATSLSAQEEITVTVDEKRGLLRADGQEIPMASPEAFSILSRLYLRACWDCKYPWSFTWMGRPIIQMPDDLMRIQEVVYRVQPDVIIETGIAHGGSTMFYSSLCRAMGRGRVISVDVEIRPHNRKALETHELIDRVTMIEGNSIDPATVGRVKALLHPGDRCLLALDSKHTKDHVLGELNAYADLVAAGSYVIVQDGWMEAFTGAVRSNDDWDWNNPKQAAEQFVRSHPNFIIEGPRFNFNEGTVESWVSACPSGFLRRVW